VDDLGDKYAVEHCDCSAEDYKEFWENCDPRFAHCTLKEHEVRHEEWQDWFNMEGKTILDYGCGGDTTLAFAYPDNPYIGVDIAERSIATALLHLRKQEHKNHQLHLLPVELADFNADILVAQQVMVHFCSKEMLDEFLANVERSGIPELLLETRHIDNKDLWFLPTSPNHACSVSWEYLEKHLPSYRRVKCQNCGPFRFSQWMLKNYGI